MPKPDFEQVRVRMAHVRSLGLIGALLAMLTLVTAVAVSMLMLFGKALVAALLVKVIWQTVFDVELTRWVFGSESVPFWKVFLLLVTGSVVAKMLRPASWGH